VHELENHACLPHDTSPRTLVPTAWAAASKHMALGECGIRKDPQTISVPNQHVRKLARLVVVDLRLLHGRWSDVPWKASEPPPEVAKKSELQYADHNKGIDLEKVIVQEPSSAHALTQWVHWVALG